MIHCNSKAHSEKPVVPGLPLAALLILALQSTKYLW